MGNVRLKYPELKHRVLELNSAKTGKNNADILNFISEKQTLEGNLRVYLCCRNGPDLVSLLLCFHFLLSDI